MNTVSEVVRPTLRAALPAVIVGDAYLAGGTWLFSEPQVGLRRLVDLTALGWTPVARTGAGLDISATCSLAALEAFDAPGEWPAARLIGQCCLALLGSFKIRRMATVGGNLCLALPAAPMAALAVALHGECTIWNMGGGQRMLPADALITGAGRTALQHGEILRGVVLPDTMLRRRSAFRQMSLTPLGRSAALLIGTVADGIVELTITAATARPVRIVLPGALAPAELGAAIDAAVPVWYDDIHGRPDWRRRITHLMAADLCRALQQN